MRALGCYLLVWQHLPIERAARLLGEVLGVPVATGTLARVVAEGAAGLGEVVAMVRGRLAAALVVHVDETRGAGRGAAALDPLGFHTPYWLIGRFAVATDPGRLGELTTDIDRFVYDQALSVFLCAPQALYAVNRQAAFDGYAATFELAETQASPQHWSRR